MQTSKDVYQNEYAFHDVAQVEFKWAYIHQWWDVNEITFASWFVSFEIDEQEKSTILWMS